MYLWSGFNNHRMMNKIYFSPLFEHFTKENLILFRNFFLSIRIVSKQYVQKHYFRDLYKDRRPSMLKMTRNCKWQPCNAFQSNAEETWRKLTNLRKSRKIIKKIWIEFYWQSLSSLAVVFLQVLNVSPFDQHSKTINNRAGEISNAHRNSTNQTDLRSLAKR